MAAKNTPSPAVHERRNPTNEHTHDPSWVPDPEWDRKMEAANPSWCVRHDRWRDGRDTDCP